MPCKACASLVGWAFVGRLGHNAYEYSVVLIIFIVIIRPQTLRGQEGNAAPHIACSLWAPRLLWCREAKKSLGWVEGCKIGRSGFLHMGSAWIVRKCMIDSWSNQALQPRLFLTVNIVAFSNRSWHVGTQPFGVCGTMDVATVTAAQNYLFYFRVWYKSLPERVLFELVFMKRFLTRLRHYCEWWCGLDVRGTPNCFWCTLPLDSVSSWRIS